MFAHLPDGASNVKIRKWYRKLWQFNESSQMSCRNGFTSNPKLRQSQTRRHTESGEPSPEKVDETHRELREGRTGDSSLLRGAPSLLYSLCAEQCRTAPNTTGSPTHTSPAQVQHLYAGNKIKAFVLFPFSSKICSLLQERSASVTAAARAADSSTCMHVHVRARADSTADIWRHLPASNVILSSTDSFYSNWLI